MKFINREAELKELKRLEGLSKKKLFVIALYGLRRVGKTRLLLEFLKGRELYFFVNKNKTSADLLREFEGILKKNGVLGELESLKSWDEFFGVLMGRNSQPAVFDEFQNFRLVEPGIFGIMQKSVDLNEGSPGMIMLSGSLIGMMKNLFRDSKEPLYGRVKRGIKLEPLGLGACIRLGEGLGLEKEELVKLFCIFGGYPKYYVAIEDYGLEGKSADEIIDAQILAKNAPLEDEAISILSQEFGARSGIYYSMLEAIACGNGTISEIAGYLNAQPTSLTRQLKELKDYFELIEFERPFRGKRGAYRISHPLMNFWFSVLHRNYSDYASRNPEFMQALKKNIETHCGRAFEKVAREFLVAKLGLTEARRQWGKIAGAEKGKNAYEIDLIGKNGKAHYVFEVKWGEIDYTEALKILETLREKAKNVPRLPLDAKFGIVAGKLTGKEKLGAGGYLAYDIEDL